jgi:hypothetical protein
LKEWIEAVVVLRPFWCPQARAAVASERKGLTVEREDRSSDDFDLVSGDPDINLLEIVDRQAERIERDRDDPPDANLSAGICGQAERFSTFFFARQHKRLRQKNRRIVIFALTNF